MSEQHIKLRMGDTLIITGVPEGEPDENPDLEYWFEIPPVIIYKRSDDGYICFRSDLSICNDGSGSSHGDKTWQGQTAYYNGGKYLNADKDKYIVVPPQIRNGVPGIVMGCRGRLTNTETGVVTEAVVGDIGPKNKTGEAAYCAAKVVNPAISYNVGDDKRIYLYELWPDVPAVVDGKKYELEAA